MRPHYYQNIHGYFDFDDIYTEMVSKASDGARFVEIGAFYGQSTAFMGIEIANSGKKIELFAVDPWEGILGGGIHRM